MLILKQYGITLKRVEESDLEEIRYWRNQRFIAEKMIYRKEISKEEQVEWFRKINNQYNYYFIIIDAQGNRIGVINSKDVDLKKGEGEGGIFIWDQKYWETQAPSLASLVLLNFSMLMLESFKRSKIKVLKSNVSAMRYNEKLGYSISESLEGKEYVEMLLTRESYIKSTENLRQKLARAYRTKGELKVEGRTSEINTEEINKLLI